MEFPVELPEEETPEPVTLSEDIIEIRVAADVDIQMYELAEQGLKVFTIIAGLPSETEDPDANAPIEQSFVLYTQIGTESLNVRKGPGYGTLLHDDHGYSDSRKVMGTLLKNTTVIVLDKKQYPDGNVWVQIQHERWVAEIYNGKVYMEKAST
jgi:hypothetical protein